MSVWSAKNVITSSGVLENYEIEVIGGRISAVRPCSNPKYEFITPMLFDIHINGGYDFHFTANPEIITVEDINKASHDHGSWCTLPTVITSPIENMIAAIHATKKYINEHPDSGIRGIHLEGPFLNRKKKGAHIEEYIIKPSRELIDRFLEAGSDIIKLWTIAPEVFDESTLDYLVDTGINLSLGHSDATYDQSVQAFDKRINLVTHLFNAMSPFIHRNPGLTGASLTNDAVWCQIILDGYHCHKAASLMALKQKQNKIILVSDALFLGKKKSHFKWENFNANLVEGTYFNSAGSLAGSAISQLDAVKYAVKELSVSPVEALMMASVNPYLALKIPNAEWDFIEDTAACFTAFDSDFNHTYHSPLF